MVLIAGQLLGPLQKLRDVDRFAIDASTNVALRGEVGEQGVVLTFPTANHWSQHLEASAVCHREDAVNDLLRGLAFDLCAVVRAVRNANTGEK